MSSMQLALKAAILCEIECNNSRLALLVTDFGSNQKPVCDFLLVNNTDISLQVIAMYCISQIICFDMGLLCLTCEP